MSRHNRPDTTADRTMHRRDVLRAAVTATAVGAFGCAGARDEATGSAAAVRHGRIRQAIVGWPYMVYGEQWDLRRLCTVARDLGCEALDLVGPETWPTLREYGLTCAVSPNGMPDPPFLMGLNNPRYQGDVIARTRSRIEECAQAGVSSVITFTGYKYRDVTDPSSGEISPDEGAANTVRGLKELAGDAERHGVTIVLEHLNSRVTGHDYKGHPGYQGDDIDYCADIIRQVGSPRVKLLFDIYHVQIMNGDVMARIREYGTDLIGHIHTAGVPGRAELDDTQEIQYAPIMRALLEIGYTDYVAQEFIPTRDALVGLREAVTLCDV